MNGQAANISSVKLGLAVAWPAFWTGVSIKIVLILLLLAAGLHPWEEPGLAFLLVLSIPIDIWALNLSARTVFLERLRLEAPDGIGLTLWWQVAIFSAIYLPIAYFIESGTIAGAKAFAHAVMEIELIKSLPVAERIAIELLLWGSVAVVVLLVLVLGWLFGFGWIIRKQTAAARPNDSPYQALVRRWDLLRVPADQPLLLTVFMVSGVFLVILLWAFMPVTTPHPHEEYKKEKASAKAAPVVKPAEALQKTEKLIAQAESAVQALEEKAEAEAKDKDKGKGAAKESTKPSADQAKASAKAMKAQAPSVKSDSHTDSHSHAADDHQH
ncbi:MAG: hypothetical protein C4293_03230 [Nitrospiraceae bacterium]